MLVHNNCLAEKVRALETLLHYLCKTTGLILKKCVPKCSLISLGFWCSREYHLNEDAYPQQGYV